MPAHVELCFLIPTMVAKIPYSHFSMLNLEIYLYLGSHIAHLWKIMRRQFHPIT